MPDTRFGGLTDEEWDRLAGNHFYSTAAWQRYCSAETQTPGDAVVSYRNGSVCWAAPIRELAGLAEWSSYRWNDHLRTAGLPELHPEGLLIGPPEGFQTHLLSAEDQPDAAGLADFVAAIRTSGRQGGPDRSTVAMFLTTEDAVRLTRAGVAHLPVLVETDAWVPVGEGGWESYLAGFPKKRRRNIRTARERFLEMDLTVSHLALADCWSALGEAAAATLRKYGHHTTPETEMVSMRRAVDILGERARVAVCHRNQLPPDEAPLGFCIYYESDGVIFIRWVGFDTERLLGVEEYYSTVFYTHIERSTDHHIRWIHAGATTAPAKALRGGQLRPLWLVDLTDDSPLNSATDAIAMHNKQLVGQLRDDPRTADALCPREEWTVFS